MRDYGGQNLDTKRTAAQTQTALFFSDAGIGAMQGALRDFATRHALDIDDSARMFAAAGYRHRRRRHHGVERQAPVHVVEADHSHPQRRCATATIATATVDGLDAQFIATPPYPEWPSGLCSVVGAVATRSSVSTATARST